MKNYQPPLGDKIEKILKNPLIIDVGKGVFSGFDLNQLKELEKFLSIDDDTLYIFVSEEIRCDEFSLEIVRTDGASLGVKYTPERCIQDGSMPEGHEDNPAGWSHLGAIHNLESGVSYDITTSDSFSAVSEDVGDGTGI